jgi:SAM-dependent methyltransferase
MAGREDRIFRGINIEGGIGLEIGPLDKPLVAKQGSRRIFYADYADRDTLALQSTGNHNVKTENIPAIDYIIKPPMPDSLGRKFDYIVSSHVAEHVPDILGWLHKLAGWLNPGGLITLAMPDYRYCFDRLRAPSNTGDVIAAFLERRQKPTPATVYDANRSAIKYEAAFAWTNDCWPITVDHFYTEAQALSLARLAQTEYIDCHCWVWTAHTFSSIIAEVRRLELTSLHLIECHGPYENEAEFYVKFQVG